MEKKRLIYMSSPYTGAVVEGQVYELLEYMQKSGWFDDVLLLQSYTGESDKIKAKEILKKFTFRNKFFWQNPYYPHLYRKSVNALKVVLKDEVYPTSVFHVRGGTRAAILRDALPNEYKHLLILDEFRGLSSSEMNYTKSNIIDLLKNKLRTYQLKKLNKRMIADNNILYTAVSPLLCKIEASEEGFDINKISMHPNIASKDFVFDVEKREVIRRELGVRSDQILVVTSSGESGAWQKDLDVLDVLTAKGYVVLNLSKKQIDKPNVISRFIPHKDMPAYLSACDAAMLWRDDVLLNNVACPSKYSEFAIMGLYVIHNGTVDIAKQFIESKQCGQIVSAPTEISLKPSFFSFEERMRRCVEGNKVFSIDIIAESYKNILYSSNS